MILGQATRTPSSSSAGSRPSSDSRAASLGGWLHIELDDESAVGAEAEADDDGEALSLAEHLEGVALKQGEVRMVARGGRG